MLKAKSKVLNFDRKKMLNPGTIVFLFLFLYIIIFVIFYLGKDHITLYQVTNKGIAQNNTFNGMILRDERVVKSVNAGYIAYYVSNNSRVRTNQTIYSIDESGNTLKNLSSSDSVKLSETDYYQIDTEIKSFTSEFTTDNFDDVYRFKSELDSKVFEITSGARYNNLEELMESANSSTLKVAKSAQAGTVSYYLDGLEDLSVKDITMEYFDNYQRECKKMTSGELIQADSPIYKILNDEKWNIVIPLDENQYNTYKESTSVQIILNKTSKKTKADIKCYQQGSEYFACLTLYKYAVQFFDERFISIDIITSYDNGLKIPNSAITEKEFYVIPQKVFQEDPNKPGLGIYALVTNEDGELDYEFFTPEIYGATENEYYINKDLFKSGTLVQYPDPSKTYTLENSITLKGVYNANNGYCLFRKIDVIYENKEYSIVKSDDPYGLSLYDNIVLNYETADDNLIIF